MPRKAHDDWILGRRTDGTRRYLVRISEPAFMAENVAEDDPDGILDGFSHELPDGRSLANFVFYDEAPSGNAMQNLLCQAERAIEQANQGKGRSGRSPIASVGSDSGGRKW